jgi:hypothetical protein
VNEGSGYSGWLFGIEGEPKCGLGSPMGSEGGFGASCRSEGIEGTERKLEDCGLVELFTVKAVFWPKSVGNGRRGWGAKSWGC